MVQIILVGLGAGAAAALLFASIASGSVLAMLLFYLAPLPILIAGLGWNHWAALVAGLFAATALGAVLGFFLFAAFLTAIAVPAWWLAYLALLARPDPADKTGTAGSVDWYPVGRLVLWAAGIGAGLVILALASIGGDKESVYSALRNALEQAIGLQAGAPPSGGRNLPDRADTERLIDVLVPVVAPAAAVVATLVSVINLWLAAKVVKTSGRLPRPWPDLAALTLPSFAPGLTAAAIAAAFLPDIAGVVGEVLATSLLVAFALVGFAVLHAITRGVRQRGLMLGAAYGTVILFVWPLLAISLLGLADAVFDFRHRLAKRPRPPTLPT
jgi:hypothetical protein